MCVHFLAYISSQSGHMPCQDKCLTLLLHCLQKQPHSLLRYNTLGLGLQTEHEAQALQQWLCMTCRSSTADTRLVAPRRLVLHLSHVPPFTVTLITLSKNTCSLVGALHSMVCCHGRLNPPALSSAALATVCLSKEHGHEKVRCADSHNVQVCILSYHGSCS